MARLIMLANLAAWAAAVCPYAGLAVIGPTILVADEHCPATMPVCFVDASCAPTKAVMDRTGSVVGATAMGHMDNCTNSRLTFENIGTLDMRFKTIPAATTQNMTFHGSKLTELVNVDFSLNLNSIDCSGCRLTNLTLGRSTFNALNRLEARLIGPPDSSGFSVTASTSIDDNACSAIGGTVSQLWKLKTTYTWNACQ
uniref:Secreted protein n=1 Tax=Achlya hypogyna TaxID=1202772 RepID=A0A0A7CNA9_ACHHY|nr:secreted protein [Achlya hypogyna]